MRLPRFPTAILLPLLAFAAHCAAPPARAAWRAGEAETLSGTAPRILRLAPENGGRTARLHAAIFSSKTHTLKVVDDPSGGESLSSAMRRTGCLAGVNGGYFHPDRTPLGLLVSGGKTLHPFERAKLLSGLLLVEKGRVRLLRTREYSARQTPSEALQAGPFLVDGGAPVKGLEATKRAERTAVATDAAGNVALLVTGPLTLADASALLATPGVIPGFRVARALNLDGGSSTAFWSGAAGVDLRPWKPVRNYLGIAAK